MWMGCGGRGGGGGGWDVKVDVVVDAMWMICRDGWDLDGKLMWMGCGWDVEVNVVVDGLWMICGDEWDVDGIWRWMWLLTGCG